MPCPNAEGGNYVSTVVPADSALLPGHLYTPYNQGVESGWLEWTWVPCPSSGPGQQGPATGVGTPPTGPSGTPGNHPHSGDPATDQYFWYDRDKDYTGGDGAYPDLMPKSSGGDHPVLDNRKIVKPGSLLGNHDPCLDSGAAVKGSYIPPATGDPSQDSLPVYSPALSPQESQGLATERLLAATFNDPDSFGGSDAFGSSFENAVLQTPPGLSPSDEAAYIIAVLLYGNADDYHTNVGTLSPALINVIDQLAAEILNGNGGDINWSAFGNYMNDQADADANGYQASYLDPSGKGSNPCGDINNALQSAMSGQRNNQRKANDALKQLDPNLKPPALPPGGHFRTGSPYPAPSYYANPPATPAGVGVRTKVRTKTRTSLHGATGRGAPAHLSQRGSVGSATSGNVSQGGFLGPHSGGIIFHPGISLPSRQGPAVADRTRTAKGSFKPVPSTHIPIPTIPQTFIGVRDLSVNAVATLSGQISDTINAYNEIVKFIEEEDFGDSEKEASDYAGLCDDTLQILKPIYNYLEDILNHSHDANARDAAQAELNFLITWMNELAADYTKYDSQHRKSKWWP